MKHLKKYFAAVVAFVLSLAMVTPAFAAGTGTITITVPTDEAAPSAAVTYKIYKVFDATVNADDSTKVSYTLCDGDSLSDDMKTYFSVDDAGNVTVLAAAKDANGELTSGAIEAIKAYVTESDVVDTVTANVGDTTVTSKALDYGYYFISTTTGTVVTIDTNNASPTVKDKNTITVVVKSAGTQYDEASQAAIAQVGTSQDFTAVVSVGTGAKNVVFTDNMSNMTYNADLKVTVDGAEVAAGSTTYTVTGAAGAASFTVTFVDSYIATLAGKNITLNYSATVTSDALSTNPATNTATISSGNGGTYTYTTEEVKVYNAKFTVTKQDGDKQPLAGAGFVIKNSAGKYYKLADDGKSITWVDSIDDATEYKSDAQGAVPAFTGLADGTYTLVEKTVPDGYNKAADSTFTIAAGDYTAANLEQTATVTNQSGTELPSTGGIGTTIFYVVGGLMVLSAGVMLITKRRMANIEK